MKNILLVALLASLTGVATGMGVSRFQNRHVHEGIYKLFSGDSSHDLVEIKDETAKRPSARIIGSATHDFGSMSRSETRDHTFVVENIGDADLTIAFNDKSCQCTDVRISKNVVPPGERSELYLQWTPKKFDLDFRQAAIFRTNDPARQELQLAIRGMVRQNARVDPATVEFPPMASDGSESIELNVYGYRDEDFDVESVELLHEDHEHFAVELLPMPADRLKNEVGAVAGRVVKVDVKPGLPVGAYLQTVRITTNKSDVGPFDVGVFGQIRSEIRIVAAPKYYSTELDSFILGTLSGDKVHEFDFFLLVKGMSTEEINIAAKSIDPEGVLSVEFSEAEKLGNVVRVPGKIFITPTDKLVNRNGSKQANAGTIVLETSHPNVKEMELRVAFTVKGS